MLDQPMLRALTLAALLIVTALPVTAGFKEGMAAAERGDYQTAYREWKPLAEKGDERAQNNLGVMYAKGLGVPKNYALAMKWYRKAAQQRFALAQYSLGFMYEIGQGVPKNYALAVKWYRMAARQGFATAQNKLGTLYDFGRGVPKNHVLAFMWFSLAAARGSKLAVTNLNLIVNRMTRAQVAKAQAMAAKWKPKKAKQAK